VRNHAHAVVGCDLFTTVTVSFRILYVFLVPEIGTRRIRHWNVTEHPRWVPMRPDKIEELMQQKTGRSWRKCCRRTRIRLAPRRTRKTRDKQKARGAFGTTQPRCPNPSPRSPD
jgi:hypothetical protein